MTLHITCESETNYRKTARRQILSSEVKDLSRLEVFEEDLLGRMNKLTMLFTLPWIVYILLVAMNDIPRNQRGIFGTDYILMIKGCFLCNCY